MSVDARPSSPWPVHPSSADWTNVDVAGHSVQFYEDDAVLIDGMSRFIGSALGAGDAAVVIATRAHRDALARRLKARGLDLARATGQGRYVSLDADETLATFTVGGRPDASRFTTRMDGILAGARAATPGNAARIAVFGEMVARLWADGKRGAAIHLEQLWNLLAETRAFRLHCAYPLAFFDRSEDGEWLERVCAQHSRVIPSESYTGLMSEDELLRAIALWQQKARALATEVEERKTIQQALRGRNEELRQALATRDEFLSTAAHELKTPVASVHVAAQVLRRAHERGQLDEKRLRRYVEAITTASRRLTALVNDLLDVSRIHAGQLALEPEPIDLSAWVPNLVERYRDHLDGRHELCVELPPAPCVVLADPHRLEQVLLNLLDNAVKYSPDGGSVSVSVAASDGAVTIHVQDRGIGLPPESVEAIFEPFGRAPNALRRHLPGMGLGLHICRNIVERHGGAVWAESPGEDQGTTIVVRLPATSPRPKGMEARDGDPELGDDPLALPHPGESGRAGS
jgi:signal transduction histidine kinase